MNRPKFITQVTDQNRAQKKKDKDTPMLSYDAQLADKHAILVKKYKELLGRNTMLERENEELKHSQEGPRQKIGQTQGLEKATQTEAIGIEDRLDHIIEQLQTVKLEFK